MFVKICGITTLEAAEAAVLAGADALGFVFAPSPREIVPERAAALCAGLPPTVVRVAVMRHPTADLVRRVCESFAPDWLQTDADDFATLTLPADCLPLPVYRDARAATAAALPPRMLFESASSGSGDLADWDAAQSVARRTQVILAGGLTAENIGEAIREVRPWGIDVSSGVEVRRGEKDPRMIGDFVARVRDLEDL
jgi:phosphoribosylanthranilate isomerase